MALVSRLPCCHTHHCLAWRSGKAPLLLHDLPVNEPIPLGCYYPGTWEDRVKQGKMLCHYRCAWFYLGYAAVLFFGTSHACA